MLTERFLTSLVLAVLLFLLLKAPLLVRVFLMAVVLLLLIREYAQLVKLSLTQRYCCYIGIGLALLANFYFPLEWRLLLVASGAGYWGYTVYYLKKCQVGEPFTVARLAPLFLMFIPYLIAWGMIAADHAELELISLIVASDVGAYFTGKYWGKRALASNISPKKTREGVIGGTISAILISACFLNSFNGRQLFLQLIVALFVSLFAVVGDLFESSLKRNAQVKDSGKLLPGHGGIYDRFDSWLAAAPIFVITKFGLSLLIG